MAQEKMTLEDWLDDLCVRFIINLPREDLSSVARICFQIEEAQWFYEDFIRPLDPALPSMPLRTFTMKMFQHCPLLASFSTDIHVMAFEEFMTYKTRVPVRGAIMLNDAMDAAVLVRGYKKGASWSFPRGKINKDEDDLDCAAREVYEETGYDLRLAGLLDKSVPAYPLEVTMHDQQVRLYVFRGIPEDTIFETRTRKEIGDIRWYNLSDLPTFKKKKGAGKNQGSTASSQEKFYMVAPFMVQLRQWILKQKKLDAQNAPAHAGHKHLPAFYDENVTDDNVLHEPLPHASAREYPENIDKATKELQQLLRIKPPTHGLQLRPQASNLEHGRALLSILQPKMTNADPNRDHGQPHIPRDRGLGNPPQSSTVGHHHHVQAIPTSGYAAPPAFPAEPRTGVDLSYNPQYLEHRPRPQVYVSNEIPQHRHFKPHEKPNPPVQLLHPQPLPPQVQKNMLLHDLHDMASSPNVTGAPNQHIHPSIPHGFHIPPANAHQPPYRRPQGGDNTACHPPQLGLHSANLLNVLKGNNLPTSAAPQSASHPSPLTGNVETQTAGQYQGQRIPVSGSGFASQYGAAAMPSTTFPAATLRAPAPFSRGGNRPVVPTDQHRVSLLDMFKSGQSTIPQSQIDGEGTSFPQSDSQNQMSPSQPQGVRQRLSAIDSPRTTIRANGQPVQRNSERNLPYGAQIILRRDSNQGSARSPALSTQNSNEATAQLPVRSHPSPASSRGRMSPRRQISPRVQLSPYQQYLQAKVQSPKLAAPPTQSHTAPSYPYSESQGGAPENQARFAGAPTASMLHAPGIIHPRQTSTIEQKNTLLSILGKPKLEVHQGKGKEQVESEQVIGPDPMPRSRVASFASQESRRSSTAPLSTADRNFLLDFLENATHNAKT
ncbi:hypothetical protein GGS21DRAFT_524179 [Xylaria nigripes]|nr:hypothetical protein GGS21DRAFT_524179 [Xylaria nigripes]